MAKPPELALYQRKSLDQITEVPDDIISVYVVENHIWEDGGSEDARKNRIAEIRSVEEFLIDPVRPFLTDFFRKLSAPYDPNRRDNPIGQGYWIQAEFGSGKSHVLSFIGALALGNEESWNIIREKEKKVGKPRRESLYHFYEEGLVKKAQVSKGVLVAVKTLVGQGGGAIGVEGGDKKLTEYILDAVAEQFYLEMGRSLPLYPTEILAERFLNTKDFDLYRNQLASFLKDPNYFDEEEQEDINDFLEDLQNNPDPGIQRDCGQRLWDFYTKHLETSPKIPIEAEEVLKHMVDRILAEGYAGLLLILDEVSLFMKGRSDTQRIEDEKALVVLSNRLAYKENLPVWTVCAAQQAIETTMVGVKNIHARERLDLIPLLNKQDDYYDIALSRVREVTDSDAVDHYFEDYKRSFSWPQANGQDEFARFFPFYPPSLEVVRQISMNLTTIRSALYFMLQTLKTQRKRHSSELITLWGLFDDVVEYEEDPSGTTKGITSIKTKWPDEWKAYENARHHLDTVTKGKLKVYRSRCEKIIKTLFLYHVANKAPGGLSHEELMNCVMEWKDHDKDQRADLQDNKDHYEVLSDEIANELAQVIKIGPNFKFNPTATGINPMEQFQRARGEAEQDEIERQKAWNALLELEKWQVQTQLFTIDLAQGIKSIFREMAPSGQKNISLLWHNREINGRVLMRDMLDIGKRNAMLPSINSPETGNDFMVFISSTPAEDQRDSLIDSKKDPRILFWMPDELSPLEENLLIDFAAYRILVREFAGRDSQDAKIILDWIQARLRDQMGTIYRIIPDSYGRGRIAAQDHSQMDFTVQGELSAILTPLITQVLDDTYISKEMEFSSRAPFNDTNAINVINGIVKKGEFPHGVHPDRYVSAAQNYGFDLQIMRPPNDKKLDTRDCRYTKDIGGWIEDKLIDSTAAMPVGTIEKNFMGVGGPNSVNYGLSRRMVQLYLLCLVRQGKIRVSLSGRSAPVEAIDYSNISEIDFKTSVLDGFDQIQRLKPPEGWDILAPFAAILLDDEAVRSAREDEDIQDSIQRLLALRDKKLPDIKGLRKGFEDLFAEIDQLNSMDERFEQWGKFYASHIDLIEPIPYLRNALSKTFSYQSFDDDSVQQDELDDLKARCTELQQAEDFYKHQDRIRAAARYTRLELPDDPVLKAVKVTLNRAKACFKKIDTLIASEAKLRSELLDPMEEAIQSYSVRYLQVYDQVTSRTEESRQGIRDLPGKQEYTAAKRLGSLRQLGADPTPSLNQFFDSYLGADSPLFPADLLRANIERDLRSWPHPPQCPLTFQNADEWLKNAAEALQLCQTTLGEAVKDKAALLHSEALRERLEQGREHDFIAGLLDAQSMDEAAKYLVQALGAEEVGDPDPIELLARYLKKIQIVKVRLADFQPGKRMIEAEDVEQLVDEFASFLNKALNADDDEIVVVELE
jgi:hypothetical protein